MGVRDAFADLGRSAVGLAAEAVGAGASAAAGWANPEPLIKADDSNDAKAKAAGEGGVPTDEDLALRDPASMFWDPFAIIEQLGFKERPTQITYGTLRAMVYKLPIITAVIQTRINQLASFAKPQLDRYALGFQIKLRDKEATPTGADKKWILEASDLLLHTGVHSDPRNRDNFEIFLRKLAWDSLTYDQCCFEVVPNNAGTPAQWYAIDASTIRQADTATAYLKKKTRGDTKYVQIYDGMIVTEYTENDLCFGVRNPRTDMKLYGYGTSELEMMMIAITSLLWAWQFNQRAFSQGSSAKGILNFKGAVPEKQLKGFRRHWYTMISGVENSWRTPITNADDLQWISMDTSNRDMEYNAWMDFLIKVVCFPPETRVTMADGSLREICDVEPGHDVLTHTGRAAKVKNVQVTQGYDGALVGLQADGQRIFATPEHPFYVVSSRINSWMKREFDEPEWVRADEIVDGQDYLVVPKPRPTKLDCHEIDLGAYLNDTNAQVDEEHIRGLSNRTNAVIRRLVLDEEMGFALGLFCAEGCVSKSNITFSFHESEGEYVQVAHRFFARLGLSGVTVEIPERTCRQVRAASIALGRALIELFGRYSKSRRVPDEIRAAPLEIQRAFLSGLIAGDGSVWSTSRLIAVTFASSSRMLVEQVRSMLLLQGVWAGIYDQSARNTSFVGAGSLYDLRIHGRYLLAIHEWLSGPKAGLLSQKLQALFDSEEHQGRGLKQQVYETPSRFLVPVRETWIEPYQGEVFNLEVEGEHTYQAERFAVHNCSLYNMDPVEVNFQYGNVGQKSALGGQDQNKEKITQSKERGLRPLLSFMASMMNRHIIWPMNDQFEFEFVGLDAETKDNVAKMNQTRVKTTRTVDELRAEDGLDAMPDGLGEVILDPTWVQWAQAKKAEEMGVMPGMEGPPGDDVFGGNGAEEPGEEGDEEDKEMDFQALLEEELGDEEDEDETPKKKTNGKPFGKSGGYQIDIEI